VSTQPLKRVYKIRLLRRMILLVSYNRSNSEMNGSSLPKQNFERSRKNTGGYGRSCYLFFASPRINRNPCRINHLGIVRSCTTTTSRMSPYRLSLTRRRRRVAAACLENRPRRASFSAQHPRTTLLLTYLKQSLRGNLCLRTRISILRPPRWRPHHTWPHP